jgi:hypothetical protein
MLACIILKKINYIFYFKNINECCFKKQTTFYEFKTTFFNFETTLKNYKQHFF